MEPRIEINTDALAAFCSKWGITRLELFGSVLREDFRPDSDVDVLMTPGSESKLTLLNLMQAQSDLESLFGRKVDLVDRRAIERSHNPIRKWSILDNARQIYDSR